VGTAAGFQGQELVGALVQQDVNMLLLLLLVLLLLLYYAVQVHGHEAETLLEQHVQHA
jgi:hypothetical protein